MQEIGHGSANSPFVRTDAYADFVETLLQSRSKWSLPATEFYVAHLLTGIRPDEWLSVRRWTRGDDKEPGL